MATALRFGPPERLDQLIARSGAANRRAAPGPLKQYASAVDVDISTACRHRKGDKHAPATKLLVVVDQLARGEHTSAWPLIAESIATAYQAEFSERSTQDLERELEELTDAEHDLEADLNRETARFPIQHDHERCAQADLAEAETLLRRAAIHRELAERERVRGRT